jgi:hypothetical protein
MDPASSFAYTRRVLSGIFLEDIRPSALTLAQLDALWEIHREYVERSRASFEAGLANCDEIILLREAAGGPIRGFVVFNVIDADVLGRNHVVIFSRWGFLARSFRNRSVIQWVGIRAWLRRYVRARFDARRLRRRSARHHIMRSPSTSTETRTEGAKRAQRGAAPDKARLAPREASPRSVRSWNGEAS